MPFNQPERDLCQASEEQCSRGQEDALDREQSAQYEKGCGKDPIPP
jgi:hypothetical protein